MNDELEEELPRFRTKSRAVAAVVKPNDRFMVHIHGGRITPQTAIALAHWILDTFDGGDNGRD